MKVQSLIIRILPQALCWNAESSQVELLLSSL